MDKSVKIILFFIVAIVFINFIMTLFNNSNMRGIRDDLQQAKRSTDSALNELKYSQSKLDSIRSDMLAFQDSISHIQQRVESNDTKKRAEEARITSRINNLQTKAKNIRSNLSTDSLPGIDVIAVK